MIAEYLTKKLLDVAIDKVKNLLKGASSHHSSNIHPEMLKATRTELEEALSYHLNFVSGWSSEVFFKDLKKPKQVMDVYVELETLVVAKRESLDSKEKIKNIPLMQIFEEYPGHIILLGEPGAGKTTSMKFLCQLMLKGEADICDRFSLALVIRFRDMNNSAVSNDTTLLLEAISSILNLNVIYRDYLANDVDLSQRQIGDTDKKLMKEKVIATLLEELNALLIMDGIDELTNTENRESVIRDIRNLAFRLNRSVMIITSRTGDFVYNIERTAQYEISPLDKCQIHKFAVKWLNDETTASAFVEAIYKSPFSDTALRPLNLAHLCAIYERIGNIPDKPKTVYKKVVNLLLEEWDQQRSIKRVSKYAGFEVDRKFDFLCHLAFALTVNWRSTVFSSKTLENAYLYIHRNFNLAASEALEAVKEIETHTGLFIQTGYDQFEFSHKSIQEYLTAEYLVRLPSIPRSDALSKLPNELAIAIAVSSNPSEYFSEIVLTQFLGELGGYSEDSFFPVEFLEPFVGRLILEKPDFNSEDRTGISLVLLFSHYICSKVKQGYDINDLNNIPNAAVYESFVIAHLNKNAMVHIFGAYDFDSKEGVGYFLTVRLREYGVDEPTGNTRRQDLRRHDMRRPDVYVSRKWNPLVRAWPTQISTQAKVMRYFDPTPLRISKRD